MSMVRELVLDTETTGLDPNSGDKLVEVGIVELIGHRPTGDDRHFYINPQRSVPLDAYNIHGLDENFLSDKPIFEDIADEFLSFIGNDMIIIHNAPFDMKFINTELKLAKKKPIDLAQTFCTLEFARKRNGNKRASLDALSKEFRNSELDRLTENRNKKGGHGALLDSYILAEVYLGLIGGREPDMFEQQNSPENTNELDRVSKDQFISGYSSKNVAKKRPSVLPKRLTKKEEDSHRKFIDRIKGTRNWSIYN